MGAGRKPSSKPRTINAKDKRPKADVSTAALEEAGDHLSEPADESSWYNSGIYYFDYFLLDHHADHSHPSVSQASDSNGSGWLAHLDGLRGIALLGVLLFHFELIGCVGGYTGVDVFLVLSGFLMTRNILTKLIANEFSLREFYVSRFWRLYPSSLLTVLLTVAAAYYVFPPGLALDVAKSALASLGLVSNILFSTEVGGYFDNDVILKPLLHMWSLSLEEQFYLFWPIAILVAFSWTGGSDSLGSFHVKFGYVVFLLGALSFSLAVHMSILSPTLAWYLLPTRAYEFALGSIALMIGNQIPGTLWIHETLAVGSLLCIIGSYFLLNDEMRFPGWRSLPCTVGTVLLINLPNTWIVQNILCNRILRFFGKISYAAYLVHWPLWVYVCYIKNSREHGLMLLGLTVVLAYIQLHICENPMRASGSRGVSVSKVIVITFLILLAFNFSAWGAMTNGWSFRGQSMNSSAFPVANLVGSATDSIVESSNISAAEPVPTGQPFKPSNLTSIVKPSSIVSLVKDPELIGLPEAFAEGNENFQRRIQVVPKSLQEAQGYAKPFLNGDLTNIYPYLEFAGKPIPDKPPKAIVFADSYYSHFDVPLTLLSETSKSYFAVNYASGCLLLLGHDIEDIKEYYPPGPRDRCRLQTIAGEEYLKQLKQKSIIVLMFRWNYSILGNNDRRSMLRKFREGISIIFQTILRHGHVALVFGTAPGGAYSPADCIERRATTAFAGGECPIWDKPHPYFDVYNNLMVNITAQDEFKNDIRFVNLRPLICKSQDECRQFGSNKRALYRDGSGHMTMYGAMLLYTTIREELEQMTKAISDS